MLNSSLIQDFHLGLDLLLDLQLSLIQLLLQKFWRILNKNILINLIGLWRVCVINNIQLFLNLFLIVRPLLKVVDHPTSGVITVQLGEFLLDDAALLVSLALVVRDAAAQHLQFLHHWVVLGFLPLLEVCPEVLDEFGCLWGRVDAFELLGGLGKVLVTKKL